MMKKIVTAVALASTAGFATVAVAQPANMSGIKPEGFYLETNLGYGKIFKSAAKDFIETYNNDVKDSGFVYNITAGYKFMPNFALDLGFWGYPTVKAVDGGDASKSYKAKQYVGTLALKGILPVDDGLSIYLKLGPAYYKTTGHDYFHDVNTQSHDSGISLYAALGVNYNISESAYVGLGGNYIMKRKSHGDRKYVPNMYSVAGTLGYIF